jgi:hypothetical protein
MWKMSSAALAFGIVFGFVFVMGILAVLVLAVAQEDEMPIVRVCIPLGLTFVAGLVGGMLLTAKDEVTPLALICAEVENVSSRPALEEARAEITKLLVACRAAR